MTIHDKLLGSVPMRIQERPSVLVQGYSNDPTEDSRGCDLFRYDAHLKEQMKNMQESFSTEDRHCFSFWTWDAENETTLSMDNPQIQVAKASVVDVIAWERMNVLWNLAALQCRQAATIQASDREERCGLLKKAIHSLHTCIELVLNFDMPSDAGAPSIVANRSFLSTWISFIETRIQRCNYSYLSNSIIEHERLAGAAAAGATFMGVLLSNIDYLEPLLKSSRLVSTWRDSAQAWELLFKIMAEFHESFSCRGLKSKRLEAACLLIPQFRALCDNSTNDIIADLKLTVEPKLQTIMEMYVKENADGGTPRFLNKPLPPIKPWFYIPSSQHTKRGHYASTFPAASAKRSKPNPDMPTTKYPEPSVKPGAEPTHNQFSDCVGKENSELAATNQTIAERLEPTNQIAANPNKKNFDLAATCKIAMEERRWVLLAIWSDDLTDATSKAIHGILKENDLVRDIIDGGLTFRSYRALEVQSFIQTHGVTAFPYLALIEPITQDVQWSSANWNLSDKVLADSIAETFLYYCSYDALEGLSNDKRQNSLPGCYPPTKLVYTAGGFRAALQEAALTKRWMLVNIQCDNVLASHFLNRDVWRDEGTENLIKEHYVFWQKFDQSEEGLVYSKVFNVNHFPHVSVLDPVSGQILWRKEGWTVENPLTPSIFSEVTVNLPSLETRKASLSRQPSALSASDEASSWDLCSLLESWDKLSMGTTVNTRGDEAILSHRPLTTTTAPTIPTEIFTASLEE